MSDDSEQISPRDRARTQSREKKGRPPKVVAVNPGLKKLALHLAEKRRRQPPAAQHQRQTPA